jgi:hypothetical protein
MTSLTIKLRNLADSSNHFGKRSGTANLLREAADEIERLQNELNRRDRSITGIRTVHEGMDGYALVDKARVEAMADRITNLEDHLAELSTTYTGGVT